MPSISLGLELSRSTHEIYLTQKKYYCLQILEDCGFLVVRPAPYLMTPGLRLDMISSDPLDDEAKLHYCCLIGRLLYLQISRQKSLFVVHLLCQFFLSSVLHIYRLGIMPWDTWNVRRELGHFTLHYQIFSAQSLCWFYDWSAYLGYSSVCHQVFVYFLAILLFDGKLRSKPWFLDLLLKQNIGPWLLLLVN